MGRTSKNIKLRIPVKPHKIKGFRSGSYRVATTISSQPRYDHFDTAAYLRIIPHFLRLCNTQTGICSVRMVRRRVSVDVSRFFG